MLESRFWSKIKKTDSCWFWRGSMIKENYGQFSNYVGKITRSHKFIFEYFNSKIIQGNHIHHKCKNIICCNPIHLEQKTPLDHKQEHKKLYCKRGHEFTPENTIKIKNGRKCSFCSKLKEKVWKQKNALHIKKYGKQYNESHKEQRNKTQREYRNQKKMELVV